MYGDNDKNSLRAAVAQVFILDVSAALRIIVQDFVDMVRFKSHMDTEEIVLDWATRERYCATLHCRFYFVRHKAKMAPTMGLDFG